MSKSDIENSIDPHTMSHSVIAAEEPVTVIYSLKDEWNATDASVIEWYSLNTDYYSVSKNSASLDSIKAPLSARFDLTSKKYKNKGVMSDISIVPDAQGQWHVSGKLAGKGSVTIPYTINGKTYKTKIKVVMI